MKKKECIIIRKRKRSIFLMLTMLVAYSLVLPLPSFAAVEDAGEAAGEKTGFIEAGADEEIALFTEADVSSDKLFALQNEDEVTILQTLETFFFVEYTDNEKRVWQGYVEKEHVMTADAEEDAADTDEEADGNTEQSTDENVAEELSDKEESVTRAAAQEHFKGIALKENTPVYEKQSLSANVLKSYRAGSILQYRSLNADWYEATVIIDGERVTGYIHVNDVENIDAAQKSLRGIGLKSPTHVYTKAATSSKKLKSYAAGTVLKYETFSKNWYEAVVYINGKKKTGYIHASHVENVLEKQEILRGIGLKSPTHVYAKAATSSKKLKSYATGTVLKYETFSKNWYEAVVYIKGKKTTGYIHASHVEKVLAEQEGLRGVGLKSPTHVYAKAATSSKKLKSYAEGTVLKYETFSKNWYEAVVYIKGKKTTGYIRASHVENADKEQKDLQGITFKEGGTKVYSRASTKSTVLRTYAHAVVLKYKSFTKDWYEATIIVNGKGKNAYIRKADVKAMDYKLEGFAQKNPTNIYSERERGSEILKTYDRGSKLIYRGQTRDWHVVTVKIGADWVTGYLHTDDVHFEMLDLIYKTTYRYDFKEMADRQVKKQPTSDGAGKVKATRGEIEFYSNPANFPKSSDEYYQFLVLSSPAGLDAKQINERILKGKGSLEGTAQAFINAGKKYSINEAYLIAHALHETGNGKSSLAKGIPVDAKGKVTRNAKGDIAKTKDTKHTVYNMFGYGAKDSCPIECGAQYAFDHGWFTIEQSIYGGIESIHTYIARGQNTLYKMRWNPDGGLTPPAIPEWYQYATHTQWAVIQTRRIAEIYSLLEEYTVEMDIPAFLNTPKSGVTTPKSLAMQSSASTSSKKVSDIPKGAEVAIVGSNVNAWYRVTYKGKTGWVQAKHVELKYK